MPCKAVPLDITMPIMTVTMMGLSHTAAPWIMARPVTGRTMMATVPS